jgi:two-component system nitrate/nitrite response regulator NarL
MSVGAEFLNSCLSMILLGDTRVMILVDEPRGEPVVPQLRAQFEPRRPCGLTGREKQVIEGLVKGLTNKLIARQHDLTEATVKVHVKSILRKTGVLNRTQAALWAIRAQTPA